MRAFPLTPTLDLLAFCLRLCLPERRGFLLTTFWRDVFNSPMRQSSHLAREIPGDAIAISRVDMNPHGRPPIRLSPRTSTTNPVICGAARHHSRRTVTQRVAGRFDRHWDVVGSSASPTGSRRQGPPECWEWTSAQDDRRMPPHPVVTGRRETLHGPCFDRVCCIPSPAADPKMFARAAIGPQEMPSHRIGGVL